MVLGAATPTGEIAFVRPGRDAYEWLDETVRELKAGDLLRPVAIIVRNYVAGRFVLRRLAHGSGYLNVQALRLQDLALLCIGSDRRSRLTPPLEASAVRAALRQVVAMSEGQPLAALAGHLSLQEALIQLFRELRRSEVDPATLRTPDQRAIARAALATYEHFRRLTADYDDPTEIRKRAAALVSARTAAVSELPAIVLFLPGRLDPADRQLLAALAQVTELRAAFPALGDPTGVGDAIPQRDAAALAAALGVAPPPVSTPPAMLELRADVQIVRAPEPVEEVREVVRRISADLAANQPLHRTAILYRQYDPYGPLVREALDRAGFRWAALDGRPLAESRAGRALLALLRLPEHKFARSAVLEWLETEPLADGTLSVLPVRVWDRLSRAANVVRGAEQWEVRLRSFAAKATHDAERYRREERDLLAERLLGDAKCATAMASLIQQLEAELTPPEGATWSELVAWTERLRARYAAGNAAWSESEQQEAAAVAAALNELAEAERFAPGQAVSFGLFVATLEASLRDRSTVAGRPGEGVLIGPVQAAGGLQFDRVYIVGLAEGAFPPPPSADPFFPRDEDPLGRRQHQRESDRQSFLTALSMADGGRLTLSTPDILGGRPAFPSRWLLEVVQVVSGAQERVDTAAFRQLSEQGNPWLRVIRSVPDGVQRAVEPADLEDRRLRSLVRWTKAGRAPADHALARRPGSPLGAALGLTAGRESNSFTPFDGNLAAVAPASRTLQRWHDGSALLSATAVQSWATCPFSFFAGQVLRIEPTNRPEDSWTIDPLTNGSLIHAILEDFFGRLQAQQRPAPDEPYTDEDVQLLEAIAHEHFAKAERAGQTGHPLVWETTRAAILADLRTFLVEDQRWRQEQRLVPRYLEQGFGSEASDAWPAVSVPAGDSTFRFRGYIDRVDVDPSGRRAYLFDYKTGSSSSYRQIEKDPVDGGRRIQLALYSRAVRQQLGADVQVGAAYWFVTTKGEFRRIGSEETQKQIDARFEDVLGLIARGIRTGVFLPVPGNGGDEQNTNCQYCDYDLICPTARGVQFERKVQDAACAPFAKLIGAADTKEEE